MDFILAQVQPHPLLFMLCAVLCVALLWPLAWLLFPPGTLYPNERQGEPSWFELFFNNDSVDFSFSTLFWLLRIALLIGGYCAVVAGLYWLLVRAIA